MICPYLKELEKKKRDRKYFEAKSRWICNLLSHNRIDREKPNEAVVSTQCIVITKHEAQSANYRPAQLHDR